MSQETAKWYVIHTYSGYEALVKDSLEKMIENNNLSDTILDIKIPTEETIEEKNGKKKVVSRKILPCYVFIKMVYSNDMWFLITNSRGVTGFVGPQGKAIPLGEDEVRKMRLEEKVENIDIEVGDNVRIISGALAGFIGTVEDLVVETQKAKVKVSMFGRDTDVEVDFIQIDKLSNEE
ncbi:MAG: transcription termination/antitermination factor NusG [Clostridiales bacterium]|nr:transcription termination/antitermination factor NusG [Clostridiales bacterium]